MYLWVTVAETEIPKVGERGRFTVGERGRVGKEGSGIRRLEAEACILAHHLQQSRGDMVDSLSPSRFLIPDSLSPSKVLR